MIGYDLLLLAFTTGIVVTVNPCGFAMLPAYLPLFVGTMSTLFGRSLGEGAQYFLAYSVGFGLVITAMTVALALGHRSIVRRLRQVLPFVHRVAGALLVLTGLYIAYYGYIEIR